MTLYLTMLVTFTDTSTWKILRGKGPWDLLHSLSQVAELGDLSASLRSVFAATSLWEGPETTQTQVPWRFLSHCAVVSRLCSVPRVMLSPFLEFVFQGTVPLISLFITPTAPQPPGDSVCLLSLVTSFGSK